MAKFMIGEEVIVNKNTDGYLKGDIFLIDENDSAVPWCLPRSGGQKVCISEDDLELYKKPVVTGVDEIPKLNGNVKGKGHRYNTDKPHVELLVPEAMIEEAKVWTFGMKKYTAHNWRKGISVASILACILRHTFAIMKGEDTDPESGCLHAAHISCNCAMLIYFYKTDQYKELDDRYKKENVDE